MNERIDELARGCYEYIEGTLDGDIVEFDYKKFAELIVNECANEIQKQGDGETFDDWDRGYEAGLISAINALHKHFGVEE